MTSYSHTYQGDIRNQVWNYVQFSSKIHWGGIDFYGNLEDQEYIKSTLELTYKKFQNKE